MIKADVAHGTVPADVWEQELDKSLIALVRRNERGRALSKHSYTVTANELQASRSRRHRQKTETCFKPS